jgi:NADH-ubiquinone oxidoreductase chain 5
MGSIFFGYLTHDMYIGLGTDFFNNSIFILPKNIILLDSEFIPYYIKLIPIYFSFLGIFLALILNHFFSFEITKKLLQNKYNYLLYNFINKKFYFDKIYNFLFAKPFLSFGYKISFKLIDKGIIENLGPNFLYSKFLYIMYLYTLYNNRINSFVIYFSLITITILFFIFFLLFFII